MSVKEFIIKAAETGANIMIGDGERFIAPSYYDAILADPEVMAKLSEAGYHLYFRETGTQAQPLIDQFSKGEISLDEFTKSMVDGHDGSYDVPASYFKAGEDTYIREHLAPIVTNATKFGVHVIAADVEMTNPVTTFDALLDKYIEMHNPTEDEISDLRQCYGSYDIA